MEQRFVGRVAVMIGGNSGIGLATAKQTGAPAPGAFLPIEALSEADWDRIHDTRF